MFWKVHHPGRGTWNAPYTDGMGASYHSLTRPRTRKRETNSSLKSQILVREGKGNLEGQVLPLPFLAAGLEELGKDSARGGNPGRSPPPI